jgi:hypothetical protein
MNCADIEILLCEFVDGTLSPARRAEVERHLAGCPACAELAQDAAGAVAFMERAAAVEPPPELAGRILLGAPWAKSKTASRQGLRGWLAGLMQPLLQPRLALSMAMTILSFSMLWKFVAPVRQLRPDDLQPARVWANIEDRGVRAWDRTVKFYENLRFVYQIQSTLREWQQQQDEEQKLSAGEPETPKADERKLKINKPPAEETPGSHSKPAGPGESR